MESPVYDLVNMRTIAMDQFDKNEGLFIFAVGKLEDMLNEFRAHYYAEERAHVKRPLADWLDLGLIPASGAAISKDMLDEQASLVLPAGTYGPGFLVLENFQVLRRYNASDLYPIFVGHLPHLISATPPFARLSPKFP